ncbi:MAG: YbjN domain-containing protein [Pseudomonadota bacterium]
MPLPTPAGLIDASDPQPVTDIVARLGTGHWRRDGFRDPVIEMMTEGVPWRVQFYGCENGADCTDLRFLSVLLPAEGATADIQDDLARWNSTHRFGKVSLDKDENRVIEMNVNMAGGVTRQNFDVTLDWWMLALHRFKESFAR